jgi:hypothetical protein
VHSLNKAQQTQNEDERANEPNGTACDERDNTEGLAYDLVKAAHFGLQVNFVRSDFVAVA